MTKFEQVLEFHNTYNCYIQTIPGLPNKELRDLRIRLLDEEYNEYLRAETKVDHVEIADALGDMVYIIMGTVITYGIELIENFDSVDNLLMQREEFTIDQKWEDARRSIELSFNAYIDAEEANDLDKIQDELNNLLFNIEVAARIYSLPLTEVFNEIHRSNMSKLGLDGKPIYREDGKVMKGPNYFRPNIAAIIEHVELSA